MSRVPPHDVAAEEALVGAMIVDPSVIGLVHPLLTADDFYSPRQRLLYATVASMWEQGEPVDAVTLGAALRAAGRLDEAGGPAGVIESMAGAGMAANTAAYAARVADCSSYRKIISACAEAQETAFDRAMPPSDLADWLAGRAADAQTGDVAELPEDLYTMDEFLDRPQSERPPWVIPGLARVGWRVMVVAAEGIGKTVLFRQIGLAAAQGVHPLHFKDMAPCRTLIVDLENPDDSIIDVCEPIRAQTMQRVTPAEYDPDRAWLWHRPGGINLRKRRDRAELEAVIAHTRPTLVCLGPIYKAYRVEARESDELAGAEVMQVFDDLRTRYGFALMLEHHAPKGSGGSRDLMPYGSSLWLRWPEIGLKLTPAMPDNSIMEVGRWRGDRLENAWPTTLERSKPWPWAGLWPQGTFDPDGPVPMAASRWEVEDEF